MRWFRRNETPVNLSAWMPVEGPGGAGLLIGIGTLRRYAEKGVITTVKIGGIEYADRATVEAIYHRSFIKTSLTVTEGRAQFNSEERGQPKEKVWFEGPMVDQGSGII